jgi:hypothetical protein
MPSYPAQSWQLFRARCPGISRLSMKHQLPPLPVVTVGVRRHSLICTKRSCLVARCLESPRPHHAHPRFPRARAAMSGSREFAASVVGPFASPVSGPVARIAGLRDLRYFHHVAQTGNMARAALVLKVPKTKAAPKNYRFSLVLSARSYSSIPGETHRR